MREGMRQALPFWPSRPKPGTPAKAHVFRRDKTSLSERLRRFTKGVFKHRPRKGM